MKEASSGMAEPRLRNKSPRQPETRKLLWPQVQTSKTKNRSCTSRAWRQFRSTMVRSKTLTLFCPRTPTLRRWGPFRKMIDSQGLPRILPKRLLSAPLRPILAQHAHTKSTGRRAFDWPIMEGGTETHLFPGTCRIEMAESYLAQSCMS